MLVDLQKNELLGGIDNHAALGANFPGRLHLSLKFWNSAESPVKQVDRSRAFRYCDHFHHHLICYRKRRSTSRLSCEADNHRLQSGAQTRK